MCWIYLFLFGTTVEENRLTSSYSLELLVRVTILREDTRYDSQKGFIFYYSYSTLT